MSAFRILVLLAISVLAAPTQAQVENEQFQRISPAQTPMTEGKVEVLEFFSYGCPHCYAMHPLISQWAAQLPKNAVLIRVPVSLGHREWGQLSRAYYALEATGDLARLDGALFEAIHKQKRPLFDEESLTRWAVENGVSAQKFHGEFNSFGVTTKATRAEQLSRSYQVSGVPQISVDGKYTVIGKSYEEMLKSASRLVEKAASEKQAANR
jgi:protein dithiol oxidoreductase (disulfide-forming)